MNELSDSLRNSLSRHLADARQRLVQTGTRNRLVHTGRFLSKGKALDIVDADADRVFELLAAGRRLMFLADPTVGESLDDEELAVLTNSTSRSDEGAGSSTALQTRHGRERLAKKLLNLAREAKTLEEEQGINVLYLAIGFLQWFEAPNSETQREAPLVLVPVFLRRNNRTSTYELETRGEEIATNESLRLRLNDDFGIQLPEIPEDEDWTPSTYFAAVADAISGQPRWKVDRDGVQLGFFSFAKLLMVKDLEPENWPEESILHHPMLRGLLLEGFAEEKEDFQDAQRLDELFQPGELIQVVDADASQTVVVEAVRQGKNLVVQGPPGTGKSQTITNIIAAAAHDRKSVLFIAEKMAALNVVHERLKKAGLADICLEVHSRSANKRSVLGELDRTLNASASLPVDVDASELTDLWDRLNAIADTMHRPIGQTDITPYRAISTLIRLNEHGLNPPDLAIPGVESWSRRDLDKALQAAANLIQIVQVAGTTLSHPLYGLRRTELLPTDRQRLRPKLEELLNALGDADEITSTVAWGLGLDGAQSSVVAEKVSDVVVHIASLSAEVVPFAAAIAAHGGIDRARVLAGIGRQFAMVRDREAGVFQPAAFTAGVDHLRTGLAAGHSFFGRFGSAYRRASAELGSLLSGPLPKTQPNRVALLDRLLELRASMARLRELETTGPELLGALWAGEHTDFDALDEAVDWVSRLLQVAVSVNAGMAVDLRRHDPSDLQALSGAVARKGHFAGELAAEVVATLDADLASLFGRETAGSVPFSELRARAESWFNNLDRLDEWARLQVADEQLRTIAGDAVADALATTQIRPRDLIAIIRHIHAEAMYRQFAASQGWLARLTAQEKAELVGSFQDRERRRREAIAKLIRAEHLARIPRGGMGAMGVIRSEIGKKRAHKPIRRLVSEAGPAIQQLKPVMLMSPISVAQFLPPGLMSFDLLVIDEASQVRPEDAIGAIARSRQVVVVGDKRQLPPTSFFDRMVSDEVGEEADDEAPDQNQPQAARATELESILTLCEARGLSSRMLKWHYRSRHPSLIEVSNEVFYSDSGGLILFPSPDPTRDIDGLSLRRVAGAYDRGGKRHNAIEAEEVAKAVAEHGKRFPNRSLGVVTFSTAQRDRINESLAHLRMTDESLDEFMREGRTEEFFVKSIENVQGDERDVIFISVGYGPRIAGSRLDSMAFGPVSSEGGERRLNVLFTRARFRTLVFLSFDPNDIDTARTQNAGARVLKKFLTYAATGVHHEPVVLGADPDSDFEVSVASEIRRLGYEVDYQVGSVGYKIDLAVRHPKGGRYMLAVECDGATYHSALWARERDRLREEVLRGLGWRFHRVWSTDWFHRRDEEVRRLKDALLRAEAEPETREFTADHASDSAETVSNGTAQQPLADDLPDYVVANFSVKAQHEPHEAPMSVLVPIVERIITIEGPVHEEEIARRVAALFRKQKAGSRIAQAVGKALALLRERNVEILGDRGFWMTTGQRETPPLRNRSRGPVTLRKASLLPPDEIAAAVRRVVSSNGAVAYDDLPRAVALLFGFQRTGTEIRPAILPVIDEMMADGLLLQSDYGLQLAVSSNLRSGRQ